MLCPSSIPVCLLAGQKREVGRGRGRDGRCGVLRDAGTQVGVRSFILSLRLLLFSKGCVINRRLPPNLVRNVRLGRREQAKFNAALREGQANLDTPEVCLQPTTAQTVPSSVHLSQEGDEGGSRAMRCSHLEPGSVLHPYMIFFFSLPLQVLEINQDVRWR